VRGISSSSSSSGRLSASFPQLRTVRPFLRSSSESVNERRRCLNSLARSLRDRDPSLPRPWYDTVGWRTPLRDLPSSDSSPRLTTDVLLQYTSPLPFHVLRYLPTPDHPSCPDHPPANPIRWVSPTRSHPPLNHPRPSPVYSAELSNTAHATKVNGNHGDIFSVSV